MKRLFTIDYSTLLSGINERIDADCWYTFGNDAFQVDKDKIGEFLKTIDAQQLYDIFVGSDQVEFSIKTSVLK